jgi:AraC-like DNA-binding protein
MSYYQDQILKTRDIALPNQYLIDRVVKAKQTIDKHFSSEIDLNFISGEAFLSKFHLIRLFKICYGKTPYQQITEKRIEKAKTLLSSGVCVSETCYELGFESQSSFCNYFKKHLGLTPTAFRKKQFLINSQSSNFIALLANKLK